MHFGCAWYPEHWPEERWSIDLALMRDAGMNVVRVSEFAWSRLEPADGRFDLDWLVRAVDLAAAHGMDVVVGTPSAAPPAWLTTAHPEVLSHDRPGVPSRHGGRCHYRATSPVYRRFSARIAEAMAERLGGHPAVIGWQIDNEYWRISYDPESLEAFQGWLRERYGSLAAMNEAWSAAYWSQDYTAWDQVPFPRGDQADNPGLGLAWRHFWSAVYVDFQRQQIDALRRHVPPTRWITHNFHPHDDLDRVPLAGDLDLVSWDAYVHRTETLDVAQDGADCDRMRCLRGKPAPFWVTETQPGSVNWRPVNRMMAPGAMRSYAWHLVGHGADAVLYWQWRSAPGGQEQYHGSLVAPDGAVRPRYAEVARIGDELRRCAAVLAGTLPRNEVALIDAWRDRWPLRWQPHHRDYDHVEHTSAYHAALTRLGLGCDVLERVEKLDAYRLVVAPQLHQVDEATAAVLRAFVAGGGHLLLGQRSGFKAGDNRLATVPQPAHLADLIDGRVRDHYALPEAVAVAGDLGSGEARLFAEDLETGGGETWLRYAADAGWLADRPAVVHHRGVTYCGAWLDDPLMDTLLARVCDRADTAAPVVPPADVELMWRHGEAGAVLVAVNHGEGNRTLTLPRPMRNLLADPTQTDTVDLPPLEVAVLVDGDA